MCIRDRYTSISEKTGASIADVIVLAGNLGIEKASGKSVDFTPGRGDSSQDQTDVFSFGLLEPKAYGYRNFVTGKTNGSSHKSTIPAEEMLIDKAQLMKLTGPEMTVLVGGMRVLDANYDGSKHGVFTKKPETLTNDFFTNYKGKVDILINNSSGPPMGALLDSSTSDFQLAFNRLLYTSHHLVKLITPLMINNDFGRIINITSTSVDRVIPGLGVSNTVRGGVTQWAKTLAIELGSYNICLLYTSPSPRDRTRSRMPSSA